MEEKIYEAELGIEMEEFMLGKVGKYLWDRAESEITAAGMELRHVDPFNGGKIRDLQNRAKVAEMFMTFVRDAIENGRFAHEELKRDEG
ncbi:MAG: hypothetical protein WCQ69_10400 [Bacteroidales bacterium]|jgi:hypothetical protein